MSDEKLRRNCWRCNEKLNKDNRNYDDPNLCEYCGHVWEKMSNE